MLNNNVYAISGAAGKIGISFTKSILDNNGRVIIGDLNTKKLNFIKKKYGDKKVQIYTEDLTKEENINVFLNNGINKFKKIDGAINCLYPRSTKWGTKFEKIKEKDLFLDLSNQLGSAIFFSKVFLKYFKKNKKGNLINISSIQGFSNPKFEHYEGTSIVSPVEYSAIKAGIISITKYLAKYYKNKNIRVNCISPGGIFDNQDSIFINKYKKSCNSKGLLEPKDLNGTLLFLLSDYSKYITGQNIVVDDGWSL